MPLVLITAPAVEPITLGEAKVHCRIDGTEFDDVLPVYIAAAREAAEHLTGRALITQTWEQRLDAFPAAEIELPKPNVLSIVSLKYTDGDGVEQTIGAGNYTFDADELPGWLLPAYGYTWPSARAVANAVRARFTAGYGPAGSDVPQAIRQWMLLRIGSFVEHRTEFVDSRDVKPHYADRLLDPFVVYALGDAA